MRGDPAPHGTVLCWRRGCRCEPCLRAHRAHRMSLRRAKGIPPRVKFTTEDEMRDAQRSYQRRYKDRHPERVRLQYLARWERLRVENPAAYEAKRVADVERQRAWRLANPDRVRAQALRKLYGLTPAAYDAMEEAQDGRCAICLLPEESVDPRTKKIRRLTVDHSHATGRVRALLCMSCNRGIGLLREDATVLARAISYLEAHNAESRRA